MLRLTLRSVFVSGTAFPTMLNSTSLYSAGQLCGRNTPIGWFNTFPIPFGASVVVTVQSATAVTLYTNLRGSENLPVVLPGSGIPLPATARLKSSFIPLSEFQPHNLVALYNASAGKVGLVFSLNFGVQASPVGGPSAGGGYIEGGCMVCAFVVCLLWSEDIL